MTTSILIAEDDALLRSMLAARLEGEEGFTVIGSVGDGREVTAAVRELQPEILLLDLNLPGLPGLKVLEQLSGVEHPPQVLVLSGEEVEEAQVRAAQSGARGFVHKSLGVASLPDAIRAIAGGETWFSPHVVAHIVREYPVLTRRLQELERPVNQLSDREREVLVRVARGLTNRQIADELYMSVSTVKAHLQSIIQKLQLANRTEAAVYAVREGLLEPAEERRAALPGSLV